MPFLSMSQRRKFHALKSQGKMSQDTIDKWEEHTPKGPLPERIHPKDKKAARPKTMQATEKNAMSGFWLGFQKRAAEQTEPLEQYVAANSPGTQMPGAPEKMLKWNDHGGVDPRTPEELQAAGNVRLITLAPDVPGAMCATCMFFRPLTEELRHGFCTNPDVKQDVTENMHCANWEHPDSHDPVAAAEEEAQEQEVEQAQAAQQQSQQMQSVGGNPMGAPVPGAEGGQPPAGGKPSGKPAGGQAQDPGMQAGEPSAVDAGGVAAETGKPSPIGTKQQSGNPLAQQALDDFQGQAATSGPMDGGGAAVDAPAKPKSKPKPKSSDKSSDKGSDKGHTINISVGKDAEKTTEKKASVNFWKDIVEGW